MAACIRRGGGERIVRCETYADEALRQINRAEKNNCGFTDGMAKDYRTQYQFCAKSNRRQLRLAANRRESELNRCIRRGKPEMVVNNCRDYADIKMRQNRRAQRLDCGFQGPNWRGDRNTHRRWCRSNGLYAAFDKLKPIEINFGFVREEEAAEMFLPRRKLCNWDV